MAAQPLYMLKLSHKIYMLLVGHVLGQATLPLLLEQLLADCAFQQLHLHVLYRTV